MGFLTEQINFKCATCSPIQHIVRGCDAPAPAPVLNVDGEDIYRCPVRLVTQQTADLLELYQLFQTGILPVTGGWLDQSAWFVKAIRLVTKEISDYEARKPKPKG